MLPTLRRAPGRLLQQTPLSPKRARAVAVRLCPQCSLRLQHSEAAHKSSEPPSPSGETSGAGATEGQPMKRHPPRQPRTYIDRGELPKTEKVFQFMRSKERPKPGETVAARYLGKDDRVSQGPLSEIDRDIRQVSGTIGLRAAILIAMNALLQKPFVPTFAQQTLLYHLKTEPDKHLLFRAETGTGKSFIMAMWALNLDRSVDSSVVPKPTTTVLIIVPNPDLAIQYHYWISRILSSSFKAVTKLSSLVQVFYRGSEDEEERQEQRLKEHPHPHVIISTPTRLLDLLSEHAERFDLDHLKYIMIDEADEIIQPPLQTTPLKGVRHAQPGEILLDWIWRKRAPAAKITDEAKYPRLVAVSSTLSYTFQEFMLEKFISKENLVSKGLQAQTAIQPTPRYRTDHFVILVSLNKSEDPTLAPDRIVIQPAFLPKATLQDNIRRRPLPAYRREREAETEYPPNYLAIPAMQRLIREAHARKVLAVVPHGSSKADFVWGCKYFGLIGAEELRFNPDATQNQKGDLDGTRPRSEHPVVLVAYTKEIRGLDLKGIDMAFIMGEFGTVEDYVHITGRTGRHLGKHGSVVTMIEGTSADVSQKLMNAAVKIVRTGSKLGEWNIPPRIEMDLKALPGDEFEEIREQKGIVTMTEEVWSKMEREKKAAEERRKWLLGQGFGGIEGENKEMGGQESQEQFERPVVFAMNEEERHAEDAVKELVVESPPVVENNSLTVDWRAALSQCLQQSSNGFPAKATDRVIIESEEEDETFDCTDAFNSPEPLTLTRDRPPPSTESVESLGPFPSKPEFPMKEYKEAWAAVMEHQEQVRHDTNGTVDLNVPSTSNSQVTSSPSLTYHTIPPEALIPNQAVPRREDVPIIPHDINVNPHSGEAALQHVMEGESLRQAEEARLLAPEIPTEEISANNNSETKKGSRGRSRKEPEKNKGKRGRPRKDTQTVEA